MQQKNINKHIAVVGLGYVGLPLALLAEKKGFAVIGIDCDQSKIEKINARVAPYEDKIISQQLKESKMIATTDSSAIKQTSVAIICVPTPVHHNHKPNLDIVKDATISVARNMRKGHLIILESTVNPGVTDSVVLPLLEEYSGMKAGKDFFLAHCPERINPGDTKWRLENIPRVVGGLDTASLKKALAFYQSIIGAPIKPMYSLREAEAVKIVENSFRDINIAFVNELAQSFSHLGINVNNVINGAATKPFSFLPHYPSCGVGGHCIPVDPYYLIEYAKKNGFKHRLLALARNINNDMPKFTVNLLKDMFEQKKMDLKGAKVTVLGLAYKPNIDDCRESPALEIIKQLKKLQANVVSFDPFVKAKSTADSLTEALKDSKAVIIATAHTMFKKLTPSALKRYNTNILIDGHNCLPESKFIKAGIIYQGIGKYHVYQ